MKQLYRVFTSFVFMFLLSLSILAEKVIVIGAGFAGLRAAVELRSNNFEVIVLEARDRVGGRVHSLWDKTTGNIVEAGGELIGNNHKEWIGLADSYGLHLKSVDEDDDNAAEPIILNDKVISGEESKKLFKEMKDVIQLIAKESEKIKNPKRPWEENYEILKLDNMSFGQVLDSMLIAPDVKALITLQFSMDNVSSLYDQSWLGILCQVNGGGGQDYWDNIENFTCEEGNQALAKKMAEGLEVIFNSEIKSIKTESGLVKVAGINAQLISDDNPDGEFSVKGDYVVLATPPTTWHSLAIEPAINLKAYQMSTGPATKVLYQMKGKIWGDKLSDCAHSDVFGESWEAGNYSADNPLGYKEVPWNGKEVAEDEDYINFNVFTGGPKCNTDLLSLQKEGLNKIYNRSESLDKARTYKISWRDEKYTRTGYSYPGLGQMTTVLKNLDALIEPNKMVIVGEGTSPVWFGFMNGALESGVRGARKIQEHARGKRINVLAN